MFFFFIKIIKRVIHEKTDLNEIRLLLILFFYSKHKLND